MDELEDEFMDLYTFIEYGEQLYTEDREFADIALNGLIETLDITE